MDDHLIVAEDPIGIGTAVNVLVAVSVEVIADGPVDDGSS